MKLVLVRWLKREEMTARKLLKKHFDNSFERGYHLGRAHACAEVTTWAQTHRTLTLRRQSIQRGT